MAQNPIVWSSPAGPYSVVAPGSPLAIAPQTVLPAGFDIDVVVKTLCLKEDVELEIATQERCTAAQAARQAQIAASIQHVERHGCKECLERFVHKLTRDEKKYLVADDPRLGRVLGIGGDVEKFIVGGGG